jgi:dihydroorotase
MTGQRTAYVRARLLDPATGLDAPGAVLVQDGKILDVGPRLFNDGVPGDVVEVNCARLALAPGLIDMHVFTGEPGAEHDETLATAGRAAAAGGVTTIVTMPNTSPVIDQVALVEFVDRRARDTALVRMLPAAAATKGLAGTEMTEFGLLQEAGAICFTDGDRPIPDARIMRRLLSYATNFDALIVQICEDPSLSSGVVNAGETATRLGLAGIPSYAETILVERDMRLVAATGGRWHGAHLSTADAIDVVRRWKARGLRISCGAAPFNFALNETAIGEYRTFAKTRPPLRDEADRKAVVEGLRDGTIDVISSAHCPRDPESKRVPFGQAAFGAVGLETLLPLTLELFHNGSAPLLDMLAKLTINPARLLGLDSGRLAAGAPADLVLFDLDAPWIVDGSKLRSKAKNTPFDGRPVQGHVVRTVVGGRAVFERKREG